ncbi:MAG: DUF6544 family protein [Cyanobacteriota bacterium]|nr:DUF6544 family protein [Cyanobacteriota bacterium]
MNKQVSLDELWNSAPSGDRVFRPEDFANLPSGARRYLERAIAPGTKLASAVRLRMHGEIDIKGWRPFKAEQVIYWDRGIIWRAATRVNGLPIWGSDRLVDGEGAMRWKLLGLFPIVTAAGSDVTRSTVGRMQGEAVWLPSTFCRREVSWTETDPLHPRATVTLLDEETELVLTLSREGQLQSIKLKRWDNPDETEFRYIDFGCVVESEGTFSGYTIPTDVRVGWYFGSDRFETEGEFFRAAIDEAVYR